MNKPILVYVFNSTQQLFKKAEVLKSINLPSRCFEMILQCLTWAILHLDHEVNWNEFLVLFQITNESIIIKGIIVGWIFLFLWTFWQKLFVIIKLVIAVVITLIILIDCLVVCLWLLTTIWGLWWTLFRFLFFLFFISLQKWRVLLRLTFRIRLLRVSLLFRLRLVVFI